MMVSIITVNLNNKDGLSRTLKSVDQQTFKEFELVIIDGGSTDGSVELIKETESKFNNNDKSITWESQPDNGIYNAMNKGILKAKGDYCYFLNSGDSLINENVLEEIFNPKRKSDMLYGKVLNNGSVIDYPARIDLRFFLAHTIIHQAVFIKRELFEIHGLYDESLKFVADWKFFLSVFRSTGGTYEKIDEIFANYDGSGITSQKENLPKLYNESNEVKREWFPKLYEEYEKLRKNSQLNIPNTWQLISEYVKFDSANKQYVLDVSDETGFHKSHLDLLNLQYLQEITHYKNLYAQIKRSSSFRLGNMIINPIGRLIKPFFKE